MHPRVWDEVVRKSEARIKEALNSFVGSQVEAEILQSNIHRIIDSFDTYGVFPAYQVHVQPKDVPGEYQVIIDWPLPPVLSFAANLTGGNTTVSPLEWDLDPLTGTP